MQALTKEPTRSMWLGTTIATLLGLLILYCVSYAPLARWNGGNPPTFLEPAYEPLCRLALETPLGTPLDWWSSEWGSNSPRFAGLMRIIVDSVEPTTGRLYDAPGVAEERLDSSATESGHLAPQDDLDPSGAGPERSR